MADVNIGQYATLATNAYAKTMADNITKNIPFLYFLEKKGKIRKLSGGVKIQRELEYNEGNYQRYRGAQRLTIAETVNYDSALYEWKYGAVPTVITVEDEVKNGSGDVQIHDLVKRRISTAEKTLRNNIEADLASDGTASGGLQIDGLASQVIASPTTGTVGGINRATYTWWRNQTTTGITSGNITTKLGAAKRTIMRGSEAGDLLLLGNTLYGHYEDTVQGLQRTGMEGSKADYGFPVLFYHGIPVVCGGGQGGAISDTIGYLLSLDYLGFDVWEKRYFAPFGGKRTPIDQDAYVNMIGIVGNLTCSNMKMQVYLTA